MTYILGLSKQEYLLNITSIYLLFILKTVTKETEKAKQNITCNCGYWRVVTYLTTYQTTNPLILLNLLHNSYTGSIRGYYWRVKRTERIEKAGV